MIPKRDTKEESKEERKEDASVLICGYLKADIFPRITFGPVLPHRHIPPTNKVNFSSLNCAFCLLTQFGAEVRDSHFNPFPFVFDLPNPFSRGDRRKLLMVMHPTLFCPYSSALIVFI